MENQGWHWAFGAAAIGMAVGLIQYRITTPNLNGIGAKPVHPLSKTGQKISWTIIYGFLAVVALVTYMIFQDMLTIVPVTIAQYVAVAFSAIFVIYYSTIYFFSSLSVIEKKKLVALLIICVASACFWSGFEQAGSSMNLFTRDYTDRIVGSFEIPTGWFQSLNAFFIVLLSPFFAALWINLGKRLVSPSYGIKCAVGLIIMGSGFIIMFFAAQHAASGMKVAPYWLVATYFLHTVGELCLSPVALSAVSKLSPKRFAGQMMGVFVLTYSIGNIISGLLAGNYDPNNVSQIPSLYIQISLFSIGIGLIILLLGFKSRFWENLSEEDGASTNKT
jgi:POT family proton-dependent oligopeptide transporter